MTGLPSEDAVETPIGDLESLRKFTTVCLEVYAETAVQNMLEAERLVAKALELREQALMLFSRCNELAMDYAKEKAKPVPEEDINW